MQVVLVVGTADTKGAELLFLRDLLAPRLGPAVAVRIVDLGTRAGTKAVDVTAAEVAAHHPGGVDAVLGQDARGRAVAAMGQAFEGWITGVAGLAGVIGIGGGGGTSMVTQGLRALPYGLPKVMVSTMASGDTAPYVGISDLVMVPAVTDLAGLNGFSRVILHNAAMALAGMVERPAPKVTGKPAVGLTMFGVTTPCVMAVAEGLRETYEPLVFHATGTGGRTMEKLGDSGLLSGFLDVTTTEVADMIVGGVLACSPDRFGAVQRSGLPWVGSLGALDMVNFGPRQGVPDRFDGRMFHIHNPQVTLMRTTPAECREIGAWMAARLNLCPGPVHLLIPEGGLSALDVPGQPWHDPAANAALFDTIAGALTHPVTRLPHHINDPAFAAALLAAFHALT